MGRFSFSQYVCGNDGGGGGANPLTMPILINNTWFAIH